MMSQASKDPFVKPIGVTEIAKLLGKDRSSAWRWLRDAMKREPPTPHCRWAWQNNGKGPWHVNPVLLRQVFPQLREWGEELRGDIEYQLEDVWLEVQRANSVLPALLRRVERLELEAKQREKRASSQGHGATPSQGHGARETARTTASEPASDRPRRPLVAIGALGEASDEIFAGSWGHPAVPDQRRRFERRRSAGCFIAGVGGGGSASSIFGLSLERYDSPSTTKS